MKLNMRMKTKVNQYQESTLVVAMEVIFFYNLAYAEHPNLIYQHFISNML